MKSITLTIIAAALVSACALTAPQERTMSIELSPQVMPSSSSPDVRRAVPASIPAVRQEATPNIDLQIYDNPDLHLAALEPRTLS